MSLSFVKHQALMNKVAEAYKGQVQKRLTPRQLRRLNLDRYNCWWKKIADLLSELGISPEQWMEVQFHEFPRNDCMQLFRLAAPPPQALCTPASVDRFIKYVGRHDTMNVLDHDFIERKTYNISANFVQMLKVTNNIADQNSDEWMDLILIHVNSGDISLVWLCQQEEDWIIRFFNRNGSALSDSIKGLLDSKIRREVLEQVKGTVH